MITFNQLSRLHGHVHSSQLRSSTAPRPGRPEMREHQLTLSFLRISKGPTQGSPRVRRIITPTPTPRPGTSLLRARRDPGPRLHRAEQPGEEEADAIQASHNGMDNHSLRRAPIPPWGETGLEHPVPPSCAGLGQVSGPNRPAAGLGGISLTGIAFQCPHTQDLREKHTQTVERLKINTFMDSGCRGRGVGGAEVGAWSSPRNKGKEQATS
ncbi:uncharacterized protein LOC101684118 [Mustela putorius furo]|uniref:Uncharacterized protein LOC101684118 n=2 Tax=Mustela putorius furo TaxID=9669 RepID=A0A8U0NTE2_MUSPF|nr:uncharacterized protein LOC101684118 [Mustela putorius furo]